MVNLVKRSQRMQLARMRVEVENDIDHLLNLNIAKSQVDMPKDLRRGLEDYAGHLKESAEKEYLNRTIRRFPVSLLSYNSP